MNLILVVIDSLRQDHVGAYGNQWIQTPNLDAFFAESVRFTRAYPESLPTLPFRRSLLTGKRVFPFSDWKPWHAFYPMSSVFKAKGMIPGWTPLPAEDTALSELLDQRGYETALFTDCFHQHYPGMNYHRGYHTWGFIRGQEYDGLMTDNRPGNTNPQAKYMTDRMQWEKRKTWELKRYLHNNQHRRKEEDYCSAQVFRGANEWLEKNHMADKFFLCIDAFDPHEPWDPPQYYVDLYDPGYKGTEVIMPLYHAKASDYLTEAELKHMRALYAAEVTMVDYWFGHFMDKVKLMGLDKNSVIVVLSDHGHQLGEKNFTGKLPWGMMPCLLDLVQGIRHPEGVGAGKVVDALTMNHDILPTVLKLMGEEVPPWAEGQDLWPIVAGQQTQIRSNVTCCFKDYFWIRDEEYALVARSNKTELELYDQRKDPNYLKNIADQKPEMVERMWQMLLREAGGKIPVYDSTDKLLEKI